MRIAFDTEFIDTPDASELISIGFAAEDGRTLYLELPYEERFLTPWLSFNVVPHLSGKRVPFADAAARIRDFVDPPGQRPGRPEFWAYYSAYDWYWLCRLFGGLMSLPPHWPHRPREFADLQSGVPDVAGAKHHALNDAISLMAAIKRSPKEVR